MARKQNKDKEMSRDRELDFGTDKSNQKSNGSRNNKNNRRRPYNKDRGQSGGRQKGVGGNDFSWYNSIPELVRDSATIPFSWPTGTTYNLDTAKAMFGGDTNHDAFNNTVPGILNLVTVPGFGWSDDPKSPMNVSAFSMYSFLRAANSGRKNYDAVDLMQYLISISQLYSYLTWVQRIYGVACLYSPRNKYLPKDLLTSWGVDYASIIPNLANFRYAVNVIINKIATFAVPSDLTFFKKMASQYADIYTEGTSIRDQLYALIPYGFYKFELDNSTVPKPRCKLYSIRELAGRSADTKLFTVEDLIAVGESLLENIFNDEDYNIICGDIIKAFGNNLIQVQLLPEVYDIRPIYNPEMLTQIQNATPILEKNYVTSYNLELNNIYYELLDQKATDIKSSWSMVNFDVTQSDDVSYLKFTPVLYSNEFSIAATYAGTATKRVGRLITEDKLMIVHGDDPDAEHVVEYSRMMVTGTYIDELETEYVIELDGTGTIIPVVAFVVKHNWNGELMGMPYTYGRFIDVATNDPTAIAQQYDLVAALHAFVYAPQSHVVVVKAGETSPAIKMTDSGVATNIDNYGLVHSDVLRNLHNTEVLSLYYCKPINLVK